MKKGFMGLVFLALVGTLVGCSLAAKEINLKSHSQKTGVFKEVKEGEGPPSKGYVDLQIKASIKTHLEGYYFLESDDSFHGQEGYPVLINIDGQAIIWKLKGRREITAPKETGSDPEEGEGMRYLLNKKIRLSTGSQTIFFALPGEKFYAETTLTLREGGENLLEFKPNYRRHRMGSPSFYYGVAGGVLHFSSSNAMK